VIYRMGDRVTYGACGGVWIVGEVFDGMIAICREDDGAATEALPHELRLTSSGQPIPYTVTREGRAEVGR